MKKYDVTIDAESVIHVGRKKYLVPGMELDDLFGENYYNKKSLVYPCGLVKEVYCNSWGFSLNLPHRSKKPDFPDLYPHFLTYGKSDREKEKDNIKRAVRKIEDIILLNPDMKYFVTLTFDPEQVQSSDKSQVCAKFEQWLKNCVSRRGLKYVFVPEYHKKDGKIHFHGVVNGALEMVDSGTRKVNGFHKPVRLTKINRWIRAGRIAEADVGSVVYNLPEWDFGFSTAMEIAKNKSNIMLYVTKYIIKDAQGVNKIMGKRYWSSRNIEIYPLAVLENVPRSVYPSIDAKEYDNEYNNLKYKYVNIREEKK